MPIIKAPCRVSTPSVLFVFLIIMLGTAHAVEPRYYQLGDGGAIAPHVAVEFGSDSNPLRRNEGSDPSAYLRLEPSLRYLAQRRNNKFNLLYEGDYFFYGEDYCLEPLDENCPNGSPQFDKASYQNHHFTVDGYLEITRKLRATAVLESSNTHQPLGTGLSSNSGTLSTLVEPDSSRRTLFRTEVSYGAPGARGELRGGISYTDQKFAEDAANPSRNFANLSENSTTPSVTLLYRIGSKTQIFGGFSQSEVRGGNSERDITNYSAGVEIDASAITSGSLTLTSVRENFLGIRGDLDYIGWEAEIEWKPRRYSTVSFKGGRETTRGVFNLDDPALSTVIGQDIGIQTVVNVRWRHFWRERFSTLARIDARVNDDVGDTGLRNANDRTTRLRLQADYNVRRWFDVGAFVVTDTRESEGVERDYNRTLIGLTANGTF